MTNLRTELQKQIKEKQQQLEALKNQCLEGELLNGSKAQYEVLKNFDIVDLCVKVLDDNLIEGVDANNILTQEEQLISYFEREEYIVKKIIVSGNVRKFVTDAKKIFQEREAVKATQVDDNQVNAEVLGG